jgi:hypothetical protein
MKNKKNIEQQARGWVPKEPIVYSIKRTITSKGLAVYFSLFS